MLKAVTRQATAVDAKIKALNLDLPPDRPSLSTANFFDHHATPEDIAVMVTEQDFLEANRELIPSVSAGELQHYEHVRATFEGGRDKKGAEDKGASTPNTVVSAFSDHTSTTNFSRPKLAAGRPKGRVSSGKGKGKATAGDSEEDSNGGENAYGSYQGGVNGRSKGKGKAVATARFQDGTASDDDGLY